MNEKDLNNNNVTNSSRGPTISSYYNMLYGNGTDSHVNNLSGNNTSNPFSLNKTNQALSNTPVTIPTINRDIKPIEKPKNDQLISSSGVVLVNNIAPTPIETYQETMKSVNKPVSNEIKNTKRTNQILFATILLCCSFFMIAIGITLILSDQGTFFSSFNYSVTDNGKSVKGHNITAVIYDNTYTDVEILNKETAIKLIKTDSLAQKNKCSGEKTKLVETSLEKNYGIVAVNLCEISSEYAETIEETIDTLYERFPSMQKGYLTNLTIVNIDEAVEDDYIASFSASKLFATNNSIDKMPAVVKMSIFLNANYFLNEKKLETVISDNVSFGYFPKGANKTSIVAHEFGHYLEFIAQVENSKVKETILLTKDNQLDYQQLIEEWNNETFTNKIIDEALTNYNKNYGNNKLDNYAFRSSISQYAVATNNYGDYIYHETIAEAFHDYYINGNKASKASIEIMKVLEKYL